ncbi:MAG: hypothetical protein F9K16_11515, partial [Thermoanaerobaculia bacterium]
VRVGVFADDGARRAGNLLPGSIAGALERRERGGAWVPVFRSLDSSWAVAGLAPGRYRIRFDAALDPAGRAEALERPVAETVEVRDGEAVEVEVILDHVSPAMVAAGAVGVVIAAVLLHEWLDGLDLPAPPRPPAWAVETAFWVTLDLASSRPAWVPRESSPQVTSHFPREGDVVAAPRVRVVFALSEPIGSERLGDDAVTVETAGGELLPGRVAWDARRWWVTWEPDGDLPRSTRLRATLDGARIVDAAGHALAGPVRFEFETAR